MTSRKVSKIFENRIRNRTCKGEAGYKTLHKIAVRSKQPFWGKKIKKERSYYQPLLGRKFKVRSYKELNLEKDLLQEVLRDLSLSFDSEQNEERS